MGDPVTIALAAISAGGSLGKGMMQAKAARDSASAAATEAEASRIAALQDLRFERQRTSIEQERLSRLTRRALASNRVAVAKSNIRADVGSPLEIAGRNAFELEMDILNERVTSGLRQRGLINQATFARLERKNALKQGRLGQYAALLGTVTDLAGQAASFGGGGGGGGTAGPQNVGAPRRAQVAPSPRAAKPFGGF